MKKLSLMLPLLFSFGCGGKEAPPATGQITKHMPAWAMTPPAGCSVGSYKFKGNISQADRVATSRARDELARQLETKVKSMIKDYVEEGESNGKDFTEELTQSVSKQVASMSLSGTVARKKDMMNDHFFTLVCLDIKTFLDTFDKMNQLSEKARQGLRRRADTAFKDLDAEVDKLEKQ